MAYTEFCCRSGGSNMNGGGLASGTEPSTSPVYSATNGGWNSGTGVFTPTSGNPSATVTVGDFANVFIDGATTPVFLGRVTAVTSTTVTVSTAAAVGTPPTTNATARSINVGGAWKGPNGANTFPFDFVMSPLTDASGDFPRVNMKNDATYSITTGLAHSQNFNVFFQGYTTTFGDGGKFTVDGGTSAIVLLNITGNRFFMGDFIFQNNGTTGSNSGIIGNAGRAVFFRGVVNNIRGNGFELGNAWQTAVECEAYACNQSNTAGKAAFVGVADAIFVRCIAHDNVGSNNTGFYSGTSLDCIECIADTNNVGFWSSSNQGTNLIRCDAYNNTSDGIITGSFPVYIDSCNLVKNGGYGINGANNATNLGWIVNCGFGSGTMANTSGTVNKAGAVMEIGSVNYASGVSPWVDAPNGDFRINLAAAKGAGRGNFTQTAASYAGAIGYPDIGSAQHQDTGGASTSPIGELKMFSRGSPY